MLRSTANLLSNVYCRDIRYSGNNSSTSPIVKTLYIHEGDYVSCTINNWQNCTSSEKRDCSYQSLMPIDPWEPFRYLTSESNGNYVDISVLFSRVTQKYTSFVLKGCKIRKYLLERSSQVEISLARVSRMK